MFDVIERRISKKPDKSSNRLVQTLRYNSGFIFVRVFRNYVLRLKCLLKPQYIQDEKYANNQNCLTYFRRNQEVNFTHSWICISVYVEVVVLHIDNTIS